MKRKSKKQIGARLIHKISHKTCTLLELHESNFTVEFDDKSVKTYSLGSLESKFNLADDVNIEPVSTVEKVKNNDVIVGQVEVVNDEEDNNNNVQKQDNEQKSCIDKLLQEKEELTKQLKDYEQTIKDLSSQIHNSDKLTKDYKKLVVENDALKEQVKSVQKQDNKQNEQMDKLLQENDNLKKQVAELLEENARLTTIASTPHAGGRPKKFTDDNIVEQMKKCRDKGESYRKIAKRFNCSVGYVFGALNQ